MKEHAFALLGRRDWTRSALGGRLVADGYGREAVAEALDYLVEAGYLDDLKYARRFVESHRARAGRGRVWLENELRAKGVPVSVAREVAAESRGREQEEDEVVRTAESFMRRQPRLDPRKLAAKLMRRGFGSAAVRVAIARVGERPPDGDSVAVPDEDGMPEAE